MAPTWAFLPPVLLPNPPCSTLQHSNEFCPPEHLQPLWAGAGLTSSQGLGWAAHSDLAPHPSPRHPSRGTCIWWPLLLLLSQSEHQHCLKPSAAQSHESTHTLRCFARSSTQLHPALSTSEAWCHLRASCASPRKQTQTSLYLLPAVCPTAPSDMEKSRSSCEAGGGLCCSHTYRCLQPGIEALPGGFQKNGASDRGGFGHRGLGE